MLEQENEENYQKFHFVAVRKSGTEKKKSDGLNILENNLYMKFKSAFS
jgi:hypothetical protein